MIRIRQLKLKIDHTEEDLKKMNTTKAAMIELFPILSVNNHWMPGKNQISSILIR